MAGIRWNDRRVRLAFCVATLSIHLMYPASAQAPKELKVRAGQSTALVNLLNAKSDCSATPGPVALPVIKERPTNGQISLIVTVANVPAKEACSARRIPTIAVVYTPRKDYEGTENVSLEIEVANRLTTLNYRIVVQATAQPL